jgi:hypothetical protein
MLWHVSKSCSWLALLASLLSLTYQLGLAVVAGCRLQDAFIDMLVISDTAIVFMHGLRHELFHQFLCGTTVVGRD